jgi:hypothetical protein
MAHGGNDRGPRRALLDGQPGTGAVRRGGRGRRRAMAITGRGGAPQGLVVLHRGHPDFPLCSAQNGAPGRTKLWHGAFNIGRQAEHQRVTSTRRPGYSVWSVQRAVPGFAGYRQGSRSGGGGTAHRGRSARERDGSAVLTWSRAGAGQPRSAPTRRGRAHRAPPGSPSRPASSAPTRTTTARACRPGSDGRRPGSQRAD